MRATLVTLDHDLQVAAHQRRRRPEALRVGLDLADVDASLDAH